MLETGPESAHSVKFHACLCISFLLVFNFFHHIGPIRNPHSRDLFCQKWGVTTKTSGKWSKQGTEIGSRLRANFTLSFLFYLFFLFFFWLNIVTFLLQTWKKNSWLLNGVRKLFAKVSGRKVSCMTAWMLPESPGWPKVQKSLSK